MAWNEPGNKDPWGRNKNNSSLDGVFKDFKKTIDDLLGSGSSVPPSPKKSAGLLSGIILAIYFLSGIYISNDKPNDEKKLPSKAVADAPSTS